MRHSRRFRRDQCCRTAINYKVKLNKSIPTHIKPIVVMIKLTAE
jgi:hypothetical protein